MTYKNSAPPGAQVVSHNRTQSDVLLASFRQPNETEEKNKGRKSKIPIGIECTSQETAHRRETNLLHPDNTAEQMENINKRLKRIEKTLFPDIDLTD